MRVPECVLTEPDTPIFKLRPWIQRIIKTIYHASLNAQNLNHFRIDNVLFLRKRAEFKVALFNKKSSKNQPMPNSIIELRFHLRVTITMTTTIIMMMMTITITITIIKMTFKNFGMVYYLQKLRTILISDKKVRKFERPKY